MTPVSNGPQIKISVKEEGIFWLVVYRRLLNQIKDIWEGDLFEPLGTVKKRFCLIRMDRGRYDYGWS